MRVHAALYARVSSERQAEAGTIQSQLADLRARAVADGVEVPDEREFVDDGVSGTTLVRPALERLRDLAAVGGLDRLYVHAPDRLARRYAYQVLLIEELTGVGVEVVFLNRQLGTTPEDALVLQMQGILAEYERATFLERSRRGKRYAARAGSVSVRPKAPYGYRYVGRRDGVEPRYEPMDEQVQVVRQLFTWVGHERLTLGQAIRRLEAAGTPTATGKRTWGRAAVWTLLRNPTYTGRALYGMRRAGPWRPPLRPYRGQAAVPHHPTTPEQGLDAQGRGALHEVTTGDGVSIPDQEARPAAPRRGLDQLAPLPGSGRVTRHLEVHQLAPAVRDDQAHVQRLEGERLDGEQVGRPDGVRVVCQEGAPALARRPPPASPVALDRPFADHDPELEQLAADPLAAPQWVLAGHHGDQVLDLGAEARAAEPRAGLPTPEHPLLAARGPGAGASPAGGHASRPRRAGRAYGAAAAAE